MMKRLKKFFKREKACAEESSSERRQQDDKDAEVLETKARIQQKLHEQAQRLHYLEVATEVDRIRSTKRDTS